MNHHKLALFASTLRCSRRSAIARALIDNMTPLDRDLEEFDEAVADRIEAECERLHLTIVTANDPDYPAVLKTIDSPPAALFVSGDRTLLDRDKNIAIVGARNADITNSEIAADFAHAAALNGIHVVSGLALGIDGAAHLGAMRSGREGATFAVVATGLDIIYPAAHTQLAHTILKNGGALVSEYPPGVSPRTYHFLERNRIVAGLSFGVIVIQAGHKSGALVTARLAIEAGREVWVVPGNIRDPRYRGSNRLIQDGAHLITSPFEIPGIEEAPATDGQGTPTLSPVEHTAFAAIKQVTELRIHDLLEKTGLPIGSIHATLQSLQQKGLITLTPGNSVRILDTNVVPGR